MAHYIEHFQWCGNKTEAIIESIVGKSAVELTFRKANQVATLESRQTVENLRSEADM